MNTLLASRCLQQMLWAKRSEEKGEQNNSVTDQMYGEDGKSGYRWGLVMEHASERETPGEDGNVSSKDDKAVYTNFQKALSNNSAELADGQSKDATLRYAHGQDTAGKKATVTAAIAATGKTANKALKWTVSNS